MSLSIYKNEALDDKLYIKFPKHYFDDLNDDKLREIESFLTHNPDANIGNYYIRFLTRFKPSSSYININKLIRLYKENARRYKIKFKTKQKELSSREPSELDRLKLKYPDFGIQQDGDYLDFKKSYLDSDIDQTKIRNIESFLNLYENYSGKSLKIGSHNIRKIIKQKIKSPSLISTNTKIDKLISDFQTYQKLRMKKYRQKLHDSHLTTGLHDQHLMTDDQHLMTGLHDSHLTTGDPHLMTGLDDLYLMTGLHEQDLMTGLDDPHLMTGNQHLMTGDPHLMTGDPHLMTGNPHLMTGDPHLMTGDPHLMTGDPHLMTGLDDQDLMTGLHDQDLMTGLHDPHLMTGDTHLMTGLDDQDLMNNWFR